MNKTINTLMIGGAILLSSMVTMAGDILPNRGAALAMGCDGADGQFSTESQGQGCRVGGYEITREIVVEASRCKEDRSHKGDHGDCTTIETIVTQVPGLDWNYWMPIGDADGTLTRVGNYVTVNGTIYTATERIGIYDKFLILSAAAGTARVVHNGEFMDITYNVNPNTGVTQFGSQGLGYIVHALTD